MPSLCLFLFLFFSFILFFLYCLLILNVAILHLPLLLPSPPLPSRNSPLFHCVFSPSFSLFTLRLACDSPFLFTEMKVSVRVFPHPSVTSCLCPPLRRPPTPSPCMSVFVCMPRRTWMCVWCVYACVWVCSCSVFV